MFSIFRSLKMIRQSHNVKLQDINVREMKTKILDKFVIHVGLLLVSNELCQGKGSNVSVSMSFFFYILLYCLYFR